MIKIPENIKPLYEKLSEKYSLEVEPLNIRGKVINIVKPANIEELIPEDPFEKVENFPFWIKIWEAAIVLADFMATIKPVNRVLEIGAGLGVVGLTAAAFGHKEVVITDYEDECLDFLRLNAALNNLANVKVEKLDWRKPKDLGSFDIIVGAEVVFSGRFFESLYQLFHKYLVPGGVVYLAHDKERMRTLAPFLYLAEKEFEQAVSQRKLRADDEVYEIVISRLIPRKGTMETNSSA
ncbi:class I SAM-dependent methyltransferase [Thermodesulfatator atlanticus]|uniref:class I SAM-dependent methyltransferase n=1 Tax=Thermodesulfatator atlanticus TaxID=501497 RepID=UPI0003B5ED51|nr:methyltransferase domain-containing protein [Thermodesulfatator atlanticus]